MKVKCINDSGCGQIKNGRIYDAELVQKGHPKFNGEIYIKDTVRYYIKTSDFAYSPKRFRIYPLLNINIIIL